MLASTSVAPALHLKTKGFAYRAWAASSKPFEVIVVLRADLVISRQWLLQTLVPHSRLTKCQGGVGGLDFMGLDIARELPIPRFALMGNICQLGREWFLNNPSTRTCRCSPYWSRRTPSANQITSQATRRKAGGVGYRAASHSASSGEVRSVSLRIVTVPFSAP